MQDIEEEYIAVGKILTPHGNIGWFKVGVYSGLANRFENIEVVYTKGSVGFEGNILSGKKVNGKNVFLKFRGVDSREDAKALTGLEIFLHENKAIELPDDTYFIHQLIDLEVFDSEDNLLGQVVDVLGMGGNDVLVVRGKEQEILIPVVAEFVKMVDLEQKTIVVRLWDGM